ncbi:hypothetical protein J4E85_009959 [Alternaria conjuncta]|uniref:uncharacterized protein n=1 Tax=Alternaria conjuncta TaxID=181017 RepID=UPI00221F6DA8|nr:uncharacterized protein J4E85_009959 [Alternaria conjuncta]KAI4917440.1 hypothetical protein J4E85_009959 [Alternaria conjuncta]
MSKYETIMLEEKMKEVIIDQATVLYAEEVKKSDFPLRVVIAKENNPEAVEDYLFDVAYTAHVVVNVTGVSSEWLPLVSTQRKQSVHAGLETLLDMLQGMMAFVLDTKPQPTDKEPYNTTKDPFHSYFGFGNNFS